jgi:hypothetical protein
MRPRPFRAAEGFSFDGRASRPEGNTNETDEDGFVLIRLIRLIRVPLRAATASRTTKQNQPRPLHHCATAPLPQFPSFSATQNTPVDTPREIAY